MPTTQPTSTNNVVVFPKVNPRALLENKRQHKYQLRKQAICGEVLFDCGEFFLQRMVEEGINVNDKQFLIDFNLAMEVFHAAVARGAGLNHRLHKKIPTKIDIETIKQSDLDEILTNLTEQ